MEKLAYCGGPRACPSGTIPPWPVYDQSESERLQAVLTSRKWWRVPGSEVDAFERDFSALTECRHTLAVATGTGALELSLASLGIGFGDEVIVPAFTFVATATAVLYAGAVPVPVDVDRETYCIDPQAVSAAITPRTRAIIPVHLAGHACDMDLLLSIARERGIYVIADAAHAHGARWNGSSVGRLCDIAMYSFQSGKLMTAGEGGALTTNNEDLAQRAWLKHSCGRPRDDRRYQHLDLGTNLRMSEFQGAVLRAQLARLPQQLEEREAGSERLDALLASIPGLQLPKRHPYVSRHAHYMYMLRVDNSFGLTRDLLVDALMAEGVPAFRAFPAIPDLDLFRQPSRWASTLPAEAVAERLEATHRHPVPASRDIAETSLWLHHPVLLGGPRVQEAVASAFRKIHIRQEELAIKPEGHPDFLAALQAHRLR